MALKFFAIVILLFLAEIVFLTTKDFKDDKHQKSEIDFTDIAFENIHGYLITADGVEATLEASKLLKYNQHVYIVDIRSGFLKDGVKSSIGADSARVTDDIIELMGDAYYENNNSLKIESNELIYDRVSRVVSSSVPFRLSTLQGVVFGNGFRYDQIVGKIEAKEIKYESF